MKKSGAGASPNTLRTAFQPFRQELHCDIWCVLALLTPHRLLNPPMGRWMRTMHLHHTSVARKAHQCHPVNHGAHVV
jgi:hypothetical protein